MTTYSDLMHQASVLQQQLEAEGYDDENVLASLESETDVLALFDRVTERVIADERLAASARERAKRLEARADKRKAFLGFVLDNLNRTKLERPLATTYWQDNNPALQIDGPVPEQYMTSTPDKPAITKALKAGEVIENCRLTQGRSIRMRTI